MPSVRKRTVSPISAEPRRAPRTPRVSEIMTRSPVTVAPHTLAIHAERLARGLGVHHLLVIGDDARLEGVFCLCDLWHADPDASAAELMRSPPVSIDPVAHVEDAIESMEELAVGCLPVLEGDRLVGVLTRGDLRRCGLLSPDDVIARICAACGERHHVRAAGEIAFCGECIERGRAFDSEDPYGEAGGEG